MSDAETPRATPSAEPSAESRPRAERYDAEGWRERVRARFGRSPHALAGALHDATPGDMFTEAEVRKRLDQFDGLRDAPGEEGSE